VSPCRSDARKRKLYHFLSTLISELYFIFVLAVLLCMVYLVYAAMYSVGTVTYSDVGKSSPKAAPSDKQSAGPSSRPHLHKGTGHPPFGKAIIEAYALCSLGRTSEGIAFHMNLGSRPGTKGKE
jgi:hypothetical protein